MREDGDYETITHMSRAIARVDLVEDDDGRLTAAVDVAGPPLDPRRRRAVLAAVASALELPEPLSAPEWDAAWRDELASRRAALVDGSASVVSLEALTTHLDRVARGAPR